MQSDSKYAIPTSEALGSHIHNQVLRNTYLMLALTMIPTMLGSAVGINTDFLFLAQSPIMGSLAMLAAMIGLMFAVSAARNSIWGVILLFLFTFVAGWWLGPLLQHALQFKNGAQLIGLAAAGTGIIFFTLASVVTVTRKDFGFLRNFLLAGLILVILASLVNLFLAIPAVSLVISAAAVLVFSGFILFDVSRIINGGETNYVMATLGIYLSLYNIFISLIQLLLALLGERD
ncbi:BAX inhibitor (BI)-1/YccA family protein [Nitrosomonas sp. HPC101]|uniref:Bax inhibitor-1/YccA family protein n=1 Tax=Nitrosomonas sp. HPC101 TaxID=1658667 RepID=UPI001368CF44|nr:Bax inhibitor-1/YccA family protein [Nitrosomonas sp. HPC101]MXS84857.1 BAX inhibitor (BI)-1/YccA family protein [Nitrosomonas sp. HPC101]